MGAEVVLAGDNYADAKAHCDELAGRDGHARSCIRSTIRSSSPARARSATRSCAIASATCRRSSCRSAAAGSSRASRSYVKALRPDVRVIGVEPDDADAMYQSLAAGRRVMLDHVGIFADGVAVREVGELTFAIVRATVDEIVRVSNDEICAAIKDVFDDTRSILEPAGALARRRPARLGRADRHAAARGSRAILSGANMNFDRLRFVAERAELGEAREALFARHDPRAAGRVPRVLRGDRPARRHRVQLPAQRPRARRTSSSASRPGRGRMPRSSPQALEQRGYETIDPRPTTSSPSCTCATWSAAAAPTSRDELLCRFEFPERPGALMQFLEQLGGRWNISLFHYRNHGADFGRVLAGFEVPAGEMGGFEDVSRTARLPLPARARQRRVRAVSGSRGEKVFVAQGFSPASCIAHASKSSPEGPRYGYGLNRFQSIPSFRTL